MDEKNQLINTDIYLIDQIFKGRYSPSEKVLDAGCGKGRNLQWFYQNEIEIYGVDSDMDNIELVKNHFPSISDHFMVSNIEKLPYGDFSFDHVICSAVLHFADNPNQFKKLFEELVRVLKTDGTLFIRMASDFGIKEPFNHIGKGVYQLNDGSTRFLLTADLLEYLLNEHQLEFIEPLKTTNVNNLRCMSTLVFRKN